MKGENYTTVARTYARGRGRPLICSTRVTTAMSFARLRKAELFCAASRLEELAGKRFFAQWRRGCPRGTSATTRERSLKFGG